MKSLYISATEPRSGKSVVAIGFMKLLKARVDNVGFLKPIGAGDQAGTDDDVELVRRLFDLKQDHKVLNPVSMIEARQLFADGMEDKLLTRVIKAHNEISADSEIVVIEGTDYTGAISALELDINAELSKTLDAPVLLVASGDERSADVIISQICAAEESLTEKGCDLIGVVVTKVDKKAHKSISNALSKALPKHGIDLLGVMPYNEILGLPRMGEVARKIEARVVFGKEFLHNLVTAPRVGAMTVSNILDRLEEGLLIITPGDREDTLLTAMISRMATTFPNISGVILTCGLEPSDPVRKLIDGYSGFHVPVLQVPYDTFETAVKVSKISASLYAGDTEKIEQLFHSIRQYVKREKVYHLLEVKREPKTTPLVFKNKIIEMARVSRKRIVIPEGTEERTLRAVSRILSEDIADIILLGSESQIIEAAVQCDAKIKKATILDPTENKFLDRYAKSYHEIRKHKGISFDHARDVIEDPIYFGTMMVSMGDADGLVSGAEHTTRHTISPAFQIIKTKPGISLVSSIFFMCLEDRVLVYGDCAVNPNPDAEQLAQIAISSAQTARAFDFEPLIAMLSYSTGTSGVGPEVEKVKEATEIIHRKAPDLKVEGPIQYDAAISPDTAKTKLPESLVAGRANIFIFPDLNAGNTAYKAVQRSAKAIAMGPVLQGLNKPVNDLSRGCLVEDIVYTIAITAIQAQQAGE